MGGPLGLKSKTLREGSLASFSGEDPGKRDSETGVLAATVNSSAATAVLVGIIFEACTPPASGEAVIQ